MLDLRDYLLEYKRKIPNILLLWMMIGAFIIIFMLVINNNFKIKNYYKTSGIVKDGYLCILTDLGDVDDVVDNKYLYIEEDKYAYSIQRLNKEIVNEGTNFYQEVYLDIDLIDKDFVNNNIVEIKIIVSEKTIFEYISYLIKGDF